MKKILFLFAALFACTLSTFAYDFEVNGIYYNRLSGDSVEVTKQGNGSKYSGSVTILATIEYNSATYYVTSIGSSAFEYCSGLTEVTIPESVTTIGDYVFAYCSSSPISLSQKA